MCDYETMDEMDSMQYHIDELEETVDELRAELENLRKQLQEESDLGHKAVQDESDSFMDYLKAEQKLDKIKEVFEKFDREQRNNPKYHHSNLLLLTESERDKLYLDIFYSMIKNIVNIIEYKPIESEE